VSARWVILFCVIAAVSFSKAELVGTCTGLFRGFSGITVCQQLGRWGPLIRPRRPFLERDPQDKVAYFLTEKQVVSSFPMLVSGICIVYTSQYGEQFSFLTEKRSSHYSYKCFPDDFIIWENRETPNRVGIGVRQGVLADFVLCLFEVVPFRISWMLHDSRGEPYIDCGGVSVIFEDEFQSYMDTFTIIPFSENHWINQQNARADPGAPIALHLCQLAAHHLPLTIGKYGVNDGCGAREEDEWLLSGADNQRFERVKYVKDDLNGKISNGARSRYNVWLGAFICFFGLVAIGKAFQLIDVEKGYYPVLGSAIFCIGVFALWYSGLYIL
jgi:hypothetical protein